MNTATLVLFLIGAFWGTTQLHLGAQTKNGVILQVSAAGAPVKVATKYDSNDVGEEDPAQATDAKGKIIHARSSFKLSRSRQLTRTMKAMAVVAAAVGLLFAASKLWQCKASLFGAAEVQLRPTGSEASTSRRLAGNGDCDEEEDMAQQAAEALMEALSRSGLVNEEAEEAERERRRRRNLMALAGTALALMTSIRAGAGGPGAMPGGAMLLTLAGAAAAVLAPGRFTRDEGPEDDFDFDFSPAQAQIRREMHNLLPLLQQARERLEQEAQQVQSQQAEEVSEH